MSLDISKITSPTLLLDQEICRRNIERMRQKASSKNLKLYPHFKTHQSREVGNWCLESGIDGIAVSSLKMAKYFADAGGYDDITVSFPVNIREMELINELATKTQLTLLVTEEESAEALAKKLKYPIRIFIEVDATYHRSGLGVSEVSKIETILKVINSNSMMELRGFYIHPGDSYHAASLEEKTSIHFAALETLKWMKATYGNESSECRLGDTPNCTLMNDFTGVDSIGPGNYVFYDYVQTQIGSCRVEDIAVCLAVPVVAFNRNRKEIIVHGGAVHLSKDFLINEQGQKSFGLVVKINENGWTEPVKNTFVKSLSQEHGIIEMDNFLYDNLRPGDLLGILPVHSCLTADAMKQYMCINGRIADHLEGCSLKFGNVLKNSW